VVIHIVGPAEDGHGDRQTRAGDDRSAEHVGHVREALKGFWGRDVRVQGVLTDPAVRAASLKWALEELQKAVEIIEKTKWR